MATWLIIALIVVLGIVVGIPVYLLVGARVAKYLFAVIVSCSECLLGKKSFRDEYEKAIDDYNVVMVIFWPVVLVAALSALMLIVWLWLIFKYCLRNVKF